MAYTKQTWTNADPATPLSAARLNHIEDGVDDADIRATALDANQGVYPLSGLGFHSASCMPEAARTTSTWAPWHVRMWVPPNQAIALVGMAVTTAGTVGAGGLNGFALYSDDGATKLGESVNADSMWTVTGLRTVAMTTPIASQSAGRFVRVLANITGYSGTPSIAYAEPVSEATLNGTASGTRRTAFTSVVTSWPSTITPDTLGTAVNFLPFIVLG